ncbi:MAG: protein kinase domain-containing protein [Akkermansiaceae bacterium]
MQLPEGYLLSEYKIVRALGKGGFAITYEAFDTSLNKRVAIKELIPDGISTRVEGHTVVPRTPADKDDFEWAIDSFLNEARVAASIDTQHPSLVNIIRYFQANGTAYLVMPYIEGKDLQATMRERGKFAYHDVVAMLQLLLGALSVVHQAGLLHRDITPKNIFITTKNTPILIDFGAARPQTGGKTQAVTTLVNADYSPIEQYSSDSKYQGAWTDIYSLAGCVYFAITGNKPVSAIERNNSARNGQPDPLVSLSTIRPHGFPPDFLAGIDKALILNEGSRPQSIPEWAAALGINTASSERVSTERVPAYQPSSPPSRKKNKLLVAISCLLVVLILCLIGGGVYWMMENKKDPTSDPKELAEREKEDAEKQATAKRKQELLDKISDAITENEHAASAQYIAKLEKHSLTPDENKQLSELRVKRDKAMRNCPGNLSFIANYPKIQVWIDGKKVRPRNGKYSTVGMGNHSLTITSSGYTPYTKQFEISRHNQTVSLGEIILVKDPAVADALRKEKEEADQRERDRIAREKEKMRKDEDVAMEELRRELGAFSKSYYELLPNNNTNAVKGIYANQVDYQWVNGRMAARDEVMRSFRDNIERWPFRKYSLRERTKFTVLNVDKTRISMEFFYSYTYSDEKNNSASGRAHDTLTISKIGGKWLITRWRQSVQRNK